MTNRERFLKTMHFEPVDHPPLQPGGPWAATRKRWEQEGLPQGADLAEYFGLEPARLSLIGIETVFCPPFEEKILEETDGFVVKINRKGVKEKNFPDGTSMPIFLEYPIKGPESLEWLRERLGPDLPERVQPDWLAEAQQKREEGCILLCNGGMYFAFLNEHMGTEATLFAYFDCPDFVHEVNELQCRCCEKALSLALPEIQLDCIGYHEDMGYKTAPLISHAMFREFMTPYYKRVQKISDQHGIDLHLMDSDGNIEQLIPLWLECGINCFTPLEAAAGMDVVALREEYGQDLLMMGGFDKRILAAGKQEIKQELERIRPVIEGGGYIPSCDHGVPPDVSLENFAYFVEGLKAAYGMR